MAVPSFGLFVFGVANRLDQVGNRTALTETLIAVQNLPAEAFLESGGQVVVEAENFGQAGRVPPTPG
jgi:hypothetical protein